MPISVRLMSPLLVMSLLTSLGAAASVPTAREPVILITAFGPFAGRGENGSATVASALDGALIAGCRVHTLVMPVVWGQPEHDLPPAVATWHPVLLLGLGEGYPDHLAVETVGRNHADPIRDEAGHLPPNSVLLSQGPMTRMGSLQYLQSWVGSPPLPVVVSQDAGGYLCNECLYTALGSKARLCGFIHLPPQADVTDQAYRALYAPFVRTVIAENLARLPSRTADRGH